MVYVFAVDNIALRYVIFCTGYMYAIIEIVVYAVLCEVVVFTIPQLDAISVVELYGVIYYFVPIVVRGC